jgi:hypothetical protein
MFLNKGNSILVILLNACFFKKWKYLKSIGLISHLVKAIGNGEDLFLEMSIHMMKISTSNIFVNYRSYKLEVKRY